MPRSKLAYLDFKPYRDAYLAAVHERARSGRLRPWLTALASTNCSPCSNGMSRSSDGCRRSRCGEFIDDPRNYGSAERFLQLAIETVLSIGNHVIADAGFDQPDTYADIIVVLGKRGVLDPELATALRPMARMRNRLVHHYADLAAERVHEIILTRLGDFDRFAEQITTHADRS